MKIKVNHDTCVGCGACLGVAEDILEINDEGLSQPKDKEGNVPADKEQQAKDAVETCPVGAIEVE